MPYSGKGRPASFCCKAHRNRAWEVRTAVASQAAAQAVGVAAAGPVREVIERTTVVEKPVVIPTPSSAPVSARDWIAMLDQLAAQLRDDKVGRKHWASRQAPQSPRGRPYGAGQRPSRRPWEPDHRALTVGRVSSRTKLLITRGLRYLRQLRCRRYAGRE